MSTLNHILAHQIPTNAHLSPTSLTQILHLLSLQNPFPSTPPSTLSRWHSRLISLIHPSLPPSTRIAGFKLLDSTFRASLESLLGQTKLVLPLITNILSDDETDLQEAALDLLLLILKVSLQHPTWARETTPPTLIQKTVQTLLKASSQSSPTITFISTLIPLFPTALRPLSTSLHALAVGLICSEEEGKEEDGSELFSKLYLLSPKGKEGLRESWKVGIEALIGSLNSLTTTLVGDVFSEDTLLNSTLPPLALPPPISPILRLESLTQVLCKILRSPTTDKAGSVEIPVGALTELGSRLVGFGSGTPVKERVDQKELMEVLGEVQRLQLMGCQILAQLGLCVGPRLVSESLMILGIISRSLSYYEIGSPMRPLLTKTYSIIITSLGSTLDPLECSKSFARVWRGVLDDISVGVSSAESSKSFSNTEYGTRKTKRQKTSGGYDPNEISFELAGGASNRVLKSDQELRISSDSLLTLSSLLSSPLSHFLPPKLKLSTSRLILTLALSPILSIEETIEFKRRVLTCLYQISENEFSEGFKEVTIGVWTRGVGESDAEIKDLSKRGLEALSRVIHPSLPPLGVNSSIARMREEVSGGQLGTFEEVLKGAEEYLVEKIVDEEKEEMVVDVVEEEVLVVEEVKQKGFEEVVSFKKFSSRTTNSFKPTTRVEEKVVEEFKEPTFGGSSFSEVGAGTGIGGMEVESEGEGESEDEDGPLPKILMSDDEE